MNRIPPLRNTLYLPKGNLGPFATSNLKFVRFMEGMLEMFKAKRVYMVKSYNTNHALSMATWFVVSLYFVLGKQVTQKFVANKKWA